MKRLRSGLVVTVSTLSAACSNASEPLHGNPPPPKELQLASAQPLSVGAPVNPRDSEGNMVYGSGASCHIELPFAEPPTSVVPPPTRAVLCPPTMATDPAWADCAGSTIFLATAGPPPTCECHVFSNPPPPPRAVSCPTDVVERLARGTR